MPDQFSRSVENGIPRLFAIGIIAINKFAKGAAVFAEPTLLLETAARVISICSLEEELPVRAKNFAPAEAAGVIQDIFDFPSGLAVSAGGGGGGAMIRWIKFVNRAGPILVEGNANANGVVRRSGFGLGEEKARAQAEGTKKKTSPEEKGTHG